MKVITIKNIRKLYMLACLMSFSLASPSIAGHAPPKPVPAKADTVTSNGLTSVIFTVSQGKVIVRLPDDLAAGDKISGTVEVAPSGKTDLEQDNNSAILDNFAVKIGELKASVGTPVFRYTLPRTTTRSVAYVVLLDRGGKEAARAGISVPRPAPSPMDSEFILPKLGQAGKPVQILGPFDGDISSASVKIGDQEAALLAESPRQLVFESPVGNVGSLGIQLKEGGALAARSYRNVSVRLGVLTNDLRAGHSTTLSVGVAGLSGLLVSPIRVMVRNRTPNLVTLAGGDSQTIVIQPADVPHSGALTFNFVLESHVPGPFSVVAYLDTGQKQ